MRRTDRPPNGDDEIQRELAIDLEFEAARLETLGQDIRYGVRMLHALRDE